jgi:hypothetical protein
LYFQPSFGAEPNGGFSMRRSARPEPGSDADRSTAGFRLRHGNMSKATYHRNKNAGRGPKETILGARKIIVTKKDEAEFDRRHAKPSDAEARLLRKMEAKRVAQAKKAAAASVKSRRQSR